MYSCLCLGLPNCLFHTRSSTKVLQALWRKHRNKINALFSRHCTKKIPPWLESERELYRPSDLRLSTKLVPTFTDRGCHMVSVMDPYCRILGCLDRNRYFFFQVAHSIVLTSLSGPLGTFKYVSINIMTYFFSMLLS
jgi:hypothetical protein